MNFIKPEMEIVEELLGDILTLSVIGGGWVPGEDWVFGEGWNW